jgi:Ca2+/Na+ antiporter
MEIPTMTRTRLLLSVLLNIAVFLGLAALSIVVTTTHDRAFGRQLVILAAALVATAITYAFRNRFMVPLVGLIVYDVITLVFTLFELLGIGSVD